MEPNCDYANVGIPNCGEDARCEGEYTSTGNTRVLKATSDKCAFVTFKSGIGLEEVLQLDADVFIEANTCSVHDNLAFWFFQTTEYGDALAEPASHWDALSEVDLVETYIGVGGPNSINTNFAATGRHIHWQNFTIVGGMHRHVTMWVDVDNDAGCPAFRDSGFLNGLEAIHYGESLPVVSVYVVNCAPGAPCCQGDSCKEFQNHETTARACITVKQAPLLFALTNWGSGHRVTPDCTIGVSDVRVRRK